MATAPAAQSNDDFGKLVLRVTVGALIVFHGLALATGECREFRTIWSAGVCRLS
jgi:hypothetical protein